VAIAVGVTSPVGAVPEAPGAPPPARNVDVKVDTNVLPPLTTVVAISVVTGMPVVTLVAPPGPDGWVGLSVMIISLTSSVFTHQVRDGNTSTKAASPRLTLFSTTADVDASLVGAVVDAVPKVLGPAKA